MVTLHVLIARSIVLYFFLIGLWGLFLAVRHRPLSPSYRGAAYLGVALAVIQALVGVILLVLGYRPRDYIHFLYGASAILVLPLVQTYLSGRKVSVPLVYGLTFLFMMGLAIRAITTGGGAI